MEKWWKTKIILLQCAVVFCQYLHSQKIYFPEYQSYSQPFRADDSILDLRAGPSLNFPVLARIPRSSIVQVAEQQILRPDTIEGEAGSWKSVWFNDQFGYVFNTHLSELPSLDQTITLITHLNYNYQYKMFPVNIFEVDSLDILLRPEFDYDHIYKRTRISGGDLFELINEKKFSLPVIAAYPEFEILDSVYGMEVNQMIYPGETIIINLNWGLKRHTQSWMLYAKGDPLEGDSTYLFKGIRNYELRMARFDHGKLYSYLIFKSDLKPWAGGAQYEDRCFVIWVGDINYDDYPDLIIDYSDTYKRGNYSLFLGYPTEDRIYFREMSIGSWSE